MITVGLSAPRLRHFGLTTYQFIADPDVIEQARAEGSTRAVQAMRLAWRRVLLDGALVGNRQRADRPARSHPPGARGGRASGADHRYAGGLRVGGRVEEQLATLNEVPWILCHGRKGGSTWWSPRCMACCRWRNPNACRRLSVVGMTGPTRRCAKATPRRARQSQRFHHRRLFGSAASSHSGSGSGTVPDMIECLLPNGRRVHFVVEDGCVAADTAHAVVVKDAGDDPDVTHGARLTADVRLLAGQAGCLILKGGPGVGTVTKEGPGLRWAVRPSTRCRAGTSPTTCAPPAICSTMPASK